jgi:hypothetical protein
MELAGSNQTGCIFYNNRWDVKKNHPSAATHHFRVPEKSALREKMGEKPKRG